MTLRALGVLLLLALPAAAEEEKEPAAAEAVSGVPVRAPEEEARREKGLAWDVEGYLSQELEYRNAGGENDLDATTHVHLDATHRAGRAYRFLFNGRLVADLVGDQDGDPGAILRDFWDTFDHDAQARLYEVFAEIPDLTGAGLDLRAGRQFLDEGLWLHFDGVRIDGDLADVLEGTDFSILGGVPVRYDESSRSDNWLVGAVVRARLGDRTRCRVAYYHVSEFVEGFNDPVTDPVQQPVSLPSGHVDDDLVDLSLWHRLRPNLRLFGRFNLLNGDANELYLTARWFTPDGRWTVYVEWYQLLQRLFNVTNDLTPYVPTLGVYEPFWRIAGRATYRIEELWVLQGGASFRALEDEIDEGTFNHEYANWFVGVTRLDAFRPGLDLTLTVNGYDTSDQDYLAVTTSADYRVTARWLLSTGVDYSLFKYVWFSNTEREDVWSYFVRVRWESTDRRLRVDGGLSVDDDRFYTYTTLTLRVTWRF